ncbi:MAG TPA: hypothetical protein PK926_04955 [Spirochaetota bacterium]|nr:hypothetical protein [Spirochaetota bacterium]HPI88189.1 hypothetical protein [Spirochaetota bacterium]HPR47964.1 hypothetical protein [Spirochaetota bacterium]
MDTEKTTGYQDQELLINAFVKFLSLRLSRSESIIKGMIRQSIAEWAAAKGSTLKDIKKMDETMRLNIVIDIIDIFLDKIKHIEESRSQREKLKKNALQIYDQWKKTKRTDLNTELANEITNFMKTS